MSFRNKVWVVEMLNDCYSTAKPKWEPCVGIGLTKSEALVVRKEWATKNVGRFRITKYLGTMQP